MPKDPLEEVRALVASGRPRRARKSAKEGHIHNLANHIGAGSILQPTATADLTLTTSAQSIVGDGDSTKVRFLLPTPGDWLIEAACYLTQDTDDPQDLVGELFVNDSGTAETAQAILSPETHHHRATVSQRWKITTTAATTPAELKPRK